MESPMTGSVSSGSFDHFQKNVYSQFGEDGVVEELLRRLSQVVQLDGWCVEFGAWDGVYLSNTYNLIKNKGYQAVLIEGDPVKYEELKRNIPSDRVVKICQFVTFDGASTLDRILSKTAIPTGFDFLSIDIDGCDYFILESLVVYRPKLVCIEFNPTIPNEVVFVQDKDFSIKQGASARALTTLAQTKGYSLIAATPCNLFFVRNELKDAVTPDDVSLDSVRDDAPAKFYVFYGYDGTVITSSALALPWHGIKIAPRSLQQLPKFLRKYPRDYNPLQRALFALLVAYRSPADFWARARRKKSWPQWLKQGSK
jgi:hypothetical protein